MDQCKRSHSDAICLSESLFIIAYKYSEFLWLVRIACLCLDYSSTENYLYGAQGNENTCVAQGFFIQVGSIACFLNVSLAIYYHLTIVNNWTDDKIKRTSLAYVLFIVPIFIGLSFAFAGIPFYDNTVVWCNNSSKWVNITILSEQLYACRLMFDV